MNHVTTNDIPNGQWRNLGHVAYPVTSNAWSLIALEGWRRGLTLEFKGSSRYRLSSENAQVTFKLSRVDSRSAREPIRTLNHKAKTKAAFDAFGVRNPASYSYAPPYTWDVIREDAKQIGFPVVLKAASWSKGKGVFAGIPDEAVLNRCFSELVDVLEVPGMLLESHVSGEDIRAFVVGDRVVAATLRVRANVSGDGSSTVRELIEAKNQKRSMNPYLKGALIIPDEEIDILLERRGFTLDSVVPDGETVWLREKANASAGGDTIDVTDELSADTRQQAVNAVKSIDGIYHGGVDLIIRDRGTEREKSYVLEINGAAELGIHLYPYVGPQRRPDQDIVDFYFPLSSRNSQTDGWFFNLKSIQALLKGTASAVEVSRCPGIEATSYRKATVKGGVQEAGLRKKIVSLALGSEVHGQAENLDSGDIEIIFAGPAEKVEDFFKALHDLAVARALECYVEEAAPSSICLGFRAV